MEVYPVRASDSDRDRILRVLRERVAEGRLSEETFERRVESALLARDNAELARLVADLPPSNRVLRGLTGVISALSAASSRIGAAWRAPRLPRFALPPPGWTPLLIGRSPGCRFIVTDPSVSRRHAELHQEGHAWLLTDLGSMNGTTVNGYRIAGPTRVRPGDEICFGRTRFILSAPAPA